MIRAFSDEVDTGSSQKMRPNKKLERIPIRWNRIGALATNKKRPGFLGPGRLLFLFALMRSAQAAANDPRELIAPHVVALTEAFLRLRYGPGWLLQRSRWLLRCGLRPIPAVPSRCWHGIVSA